MTYYYRSHADDLYHVKKLSDEHGQPSLLAIVTTETEAQEIAAQHYDRPNA